MVIFGMVKYAPGDKIAEGSPFAQSSYRQEIARANLQAAAVHLHLDLPVFYCALTTADQPDTLDRIFPYTRRERLVKLLEQNGSWPNVQRYEDALLAADHAVWRDTTLLAKPMRGVLSELREERPLEFIDTLAAAVQRLGVQSASQKQLEALAQAAHVLRTDLHPENSWRPALHWYGRSNQYHYWLSGFLCGELGYSITFGHPVWETLRFSLLTTLFVNGLALFLAFRIAIPLGIAMARRKGRFEKFSRWILLLLHAMPGFWLAGLLLLFFATPHTGLNLINGIDLNWYDPTDGPFLLWVGENADKFILPVLTLTLHALAVIALQLRGGIREVFTQDFIRTARAKGVSEKDVYRRHAFRNSLIPLITVFANVFPAIFAGSIVVEYLFNFPGMGMKTYQAYLYEDYPLLFAILMLAAVVTVAGNFLGDILYVWVDPRVQFSRQ